MYLFVNSLTAPSVTGIHGVKWMNDKSMIILRDSERSGRDLIDVKSRNCLVRTEEIHEISRSG
jgi:hypothetical protein